MKKTVSPLLVAVAALTLAVTSGVVAASAQTIYAVGTDNTFGSFNLNTRQYTQISTSLGGGNTYNITLDGAGGFYGTQNANVPDDTFVRITAAGVVTQIGATQGMGDAMFGLSRAADGTLYGYGGSTSTVGTVNPATGVYTSLGNAGFAASGFGGDLAFSASTLYAISSDNGGSLHTVNTTTGAFGAQIGASNSAYSTNSAVFSYGASLYVLSNTDLYSVNTGSGLLTLLGAINGTGLTSSFQAASPLTVAVPEPSAWVLVAGGVVVLGVSQLRRRRVAQR